MFLLNIILAWNINIIMNKKYDNNNIIIASRAYFLQSPTCTRVNNLVILAPLTPMAFRCYSYALHVVTLSTGLTVLGPFVFAYLLRQHALLIFYEMVSYKLGLLVRPLFLCRDYVATIVIQ
jgi:hypothetical protein